MNKHEKVQACNKSWSAASRNHKEVLDLTPKLKLAEGLYNHPVSVTGVLYPVAIFAEGSMLSLQLYSEIQILLQGAPGFVHAIATVALAVLLSLFLHVLVLTILPLTRSDLYLYYLETVQESKLTRPEHWLLGLRKASLNNHPRLAAGVLAVIIIGLSIARGILINRQSGLEDWNWVWIAVSIIIGFALIGVALILAPHYLIWKHRRGLKQKHQEADRQRSRNLDKFSKSARQLFDFPRVSSRLIEPPAVGAQEQKTYERYLALQNDDGSLQCLVPTQRQHIEVRANGQAAEGVKIYAIYDNDKIEMTLSESDGKACLEWKSFEQTLHTLSIGPHLINNFQTTSQPLKIELFGDGPSTLKIDKS